MDLLVYRTILVVIFSFTYFGVIESNVIIAVLTLLLMFILEPLQLCLFRTTLGKLLFGLRVTNNDGGRLTYGEALHRTWYVFLYGMGLGIPILELIANWRNYKRCRDGGMLHWEDYSNIVPRSMTWKNAVSISAAAVIWIVVIVLTINLSQMPPNSGDLTVAQFAENYNFLVERYDLNLRHMTSEGQLYVSELDGSDGSIGEIGKQGNVVINVTTKPRLEFEYTIDNGFITAVTARSELRGAEIVAGSTEEQLLIVLAFGGVRKEMGSGNSHRKFMEEKLRSEPFKNLDFSMFGLRIERTVETRNYITAGDMLMERDGVEGLYRESFTVSLKK